jgi:hypothetical protein
MVSVVATDVEKNDFKHPFAGNVKVPNINWIEQLKKANYLI